jgi:hypothetical protein
LMFRTSLLSGTVVVFASPGRGLERKAAPHAGRRCCPANWRLSQL